MDFCDVLNIPINKSGVKKVSSDRTILVSPPTINLWPSTVLASL